MVLINYRLYSGEMGLFWCAKKWHFGVFWRLSTNFSNSTSTVPVPPRRLCERGCTMLEQV